MRGLRVSEDMPGSSWRPPPPDEGFTFDSEDSKTIDMIYALSQGNDQLTMNHRYEVIDVTNIKQIRIPKATSYRDLPRTAPAVNDVNSSAASSAFSSSIGETTGSLADLVTPGKRIVGVMGFFKDATPNRGHDDIPGMSWKRFKLIGGTEAERYLSLSKVYGPGAERGVIVYNESQNLHNLARTVNMPASGYPPRGAAEEPMPRLPDIGQHAAAGTPQPPTPDAVDGLLNAVMNTGGALIGEDFAPMDASKPMDRAFDDAAFDARVHRMETEDAFLDEYLPRLGDQ